MYPRRPKAEAFSNAVDVVKRLRDPTDQLPNARHLRAERVLNSEVPCVWYLIGRIVKTYDYINRVVNASAFGLRGYVDNTLPSRCYASP